MFITNRGKRRILEAVFRRTNIHTSYYLALVTGDVTPTVDTETLGELVQCAAGNGYTNGGLAVSRNSTDFDVLTEDDTNQRAFIQLKDFTWTASGGAIPASGNKPKYAVLTGPGTTVADREVLAVAYLSEGEYAPSGGTIVVKDFTIFLRYTDTWTVKGLYRLLDWYFRGTTMPTYFYAPLFTDASAPGPATNTVSNLTQIAVNNGYDSGGFQLNPNATDFPTLTEDDGENEAVITVNDVTWIADGGSIPASGDGASYVGLSDDNATVASRELIAVFTLPDEYSASEGQQLTIPDMELSLSQP